MLTYSARNLSKKNHAVLLLHAFPLSSDMWLAQLDELESMGFMVVAPNAFGFNDSPSKSDWSFSDYADALLMLIKSLEIQKATLVGISMGGYKAFAFWKKYPSFVRSLVLCATRAEADSAEDKANRYKFIDALKQNGINEAIERMLPKLIGTTSKKNIELIAQVKRLIEQQPTSSIIEALKALALREDAFSLLASIHVPTLIMCGSEDELISKSTIEKLHQGVNHSTFTTIEDAGHLINIEQPKAFNQLLVQHFSKLESNEI